MIALEEAPTAKPARKQTISPGRPKGGNEVKNTTERIFATGGTWRGDWAFFLELKKNNPLSGAFWNEAVSNNPGGRIPNFNPTEQDEMMEKLRAEYDKPY